MSEHVTRAEKRTDSIATQPTDHLRRVPVAGGVLAYDPTTETLGKELVGFEDVTDWDDLRSALAARGHSPGSIHHLPVLDQ